MKWLTDFWHVDNGFSRRTFETLALFFFSFFVRIAFSLLLCIFLTHAVWSCGVRWPIQIDSRFCCTYVNVWVVRIRYAAAVNDKEIHFSYSVILEGYELNNSNGKWNYMVFLWSVFWLAAIQFFSARKFRIKERPQCTAAQDVRHPKGAHTQVPEDIDRDDVLCVGWWLMAHEQWTVTDRISWLWIKKEKLKKKTDNQCNQLVVTSAGDGRDAFRRTILEFDTEFGDWKYSTRRKVHMRRFKRVIASTAYHEYMNIAAENGKKISEAAN